MKLTNIVFCLTLLAGAATSCIREDLDDCLSTNTLLLSYKGDGTTEIFPDKICRVEMFVFDAENRCVNSSILPEEQVKDRTATLPPLAAGDYRIVCLGNTHHTKVDGIATGDFGRMLFAGEEATKKAKVLSGGERVRCMLCKMMVSGANVLILDEPTNHLDLESITALNNGLISFPGTLLFTSHDHQFVQTIADRIIEILPDRVIDRKETYDEYLASLAEEDLKKLR